MSCKPAKKMPDSELVTAQMIPFHFDDTQLREPLFNGMEQLPADCHIVSYDQKHDNF